jgi:hypothetical protein
MGCPTRVFENRFGPKTSIGRGNLSFTTINIVKLAIECMGIENQEDRIHEFFQKLDSVLEISSFGETYADEELRHSLEEFAKENGASALHDMLREVDPESAEAIHANNVKRVIRALEIYKCAGKPKSVIDKENKA